MSKKSLNTIGAAALAILLFALCAQVRVSAQDKSNDDANSEQNTSSSSKASLRSGNKQGLVGSWNLEVTLRDCQTGMEIITFPAMNTYNQGGTSQQSAPPEPGFTHLTGHGVWSHKTGRNYSGAFQFFSLTPMGFVAKRTTVRSAISLGRDGNSYTSTDTSETIDANGNSTMGCSTTTATRFQ